MTTATKTMETETDDGYNGWENWETWNVALWMGNDESLYRATKRCYSADNLRETLTTWMGDKTPDMDDASDMDDVNWDELYNSLEE